MFGRKNSDVGVRFKHARYLGGIPGKTGEMTGALTFEVDRVALLWGGQPMVPAVPRDKITAIELLDGHRDQVEGVLGATYTTRTDETTVVLHLTDGATPIFRVKGVDPIAVRGRLANWLNEAHIALRT